MELVESLFKLVSHLQSLNRHPDCPSQLILRLGPYHRVKREASLKHRQHGKEKNNTISSHKPGHEL